MRDVRADIYARLMSPSRVIRDTLVARYPETRRYRSVKLVGNENITYEKRKRFFTSGSIYTSSDARPGDTPFDSTI